MLECLPYCSVMTCHLSVVASQFSLKSLEWAYDLDPPAHADTQISCFDPRLLLNYHMNKKGELPAYIFLLFKLFTVIDLIRLS